MIMMIIDVMAMATPTPMIMMIIDLMGMATPTPMFMMFIDVMGMANPTDTHTLTHTESGLQGARRYAQ